MSGIEHQRQFSEWLERHKGLIFKVVRAYAFTTQDREDLFQDVAAQLWRSIPRFQGQSKESTWIYRVALFSAISWARREQRHREGRQSLEGVERMSVDVTATDDRLEWLYERIGRLNPVDRSLILLSLDGFSYREMAEVLGISESNVGVKLHRIKRRLTETSEEVQAHGV
jgi:RNA polymerase sigma-70 factor (ECF subfamily)